MKRVLRIGLICLLAAGLAGCGQTKPAAAGPWGVTVEEIDLDKPENQKYVKWAKRQEKTLEWTLFWPALKMMPKYYWFDILKSTMPGNRANDPRVNQLLPWNDTKEVVFRDVAEDEHEAHTALLVRDKATGETEQIDECRSHPDALIIFDAVMILSDTQILYHKWHLDGSFINEYFLYDLRIGERVCVSSDRCDLCDLGKKRYLWFEQQEGAIYLIDACALKAGEKDAKRTLVRWDSDYGYRNIHHLSSDKRFVFVEFYRGSDDTRHRGVYNVETGEQVALVETSHLPASIWDAWVFINNDMEYGYRATGDADDTTIDSFYIIHYDRTGGRP